MLCMILLYGLHQILKILMTIETTRRFSEDGNNGALEILLVSPLAVSAMVEGHCRALRSAFARPAMQLCLLNVALLAAALCFPKAFELRGKDLVLFCAMVLAGMLMLWFDFRAILWCGMWRALFHRRQSRAVLTTILSVLGLPWFCIFLSFTGIGDYFDTFTRIITMVVSWLTLGALTDVIVTTRAKRILRRRFRMLVARQS